MVAPILALSSEHAGTDPCQSLLSTPLSALEGDAPARAVAINAEALDDFGACVATIQGPADDMAKWVLTHINNSRPPLSNEWSPSSSALNLPGEQKRIPGGKLVPAPIASLHAKTTEFQAAPGATPALSLIKLNREAADAWWWFLATPSAQTGISTITLKAAKGSNGEWGSLGWESITAS